MNINTNGLLLMSGGLDGTLAAKPTDGAAPTGCAQGRVGPPRPTLSTISCAQPTDRWILSEASPLRLTPARANAHFAPFLAELEDDRVDFQAGLLFGVDIGVLLDQLA